MNKPTDDLFAPIIAAEHQRLRDAGWTPCQYRPRYWTAPDGKTVKHEEVALKIVTEEQP